LGIDSFNYSVRHCSAYACDPIDNLGNWVVVENLPNSNQNFFTIRADNDDRTYSFQVKANNECGDGPWSETLTVNIAQAPGRINITSVQIGCSIQFQWQRPEDNGAEIVGYKLEVQTRNTLQGGLGWAVVPNCGTFIQ
jgi:hypothetical protein